MNRRLRPSYWRRKVKNCLWIRRLRLRYFVARHRDCPKGARHDWSDEKVPGDAIAGTTLHLIAMIGPEHFSLRQCRRCFGVAWFYDDVHPAGFQPRIRKPPLLEFK
jgi:hypothetical protein